MKFFLLLFIIIILLSVYYLNNAKILEKFGNISDTINENINKLKRNTRTYKDNFSSSMSENVKRHLRLNNLGVY